MSSNIVENRPTEILIEGRVDWQADGTPAEHAVIQVTYTIVARDMFTSTPISPLLPLTPPTVWYFDLRVNMFVQVFEPALCNFGYVQNSPVAYFFTRYPGTYKIVASFPVPFTDAKRNLLYMWVPPSPMMSVKMIAEAPYKVKIHVRGEIEARKDRNQKMCLVDTTDALVVGLYRKRKGKDKGSSSSSSSSSDSGSESDSVSWGRGGRRDSGRYDVVIIPDLYPLYLYDIYLFNSIGNMGFPDFPAAEIGEHMGDLVQATGEMFSETLGPAIDAMMEAGTDIAEIGVDAISNFDFGAVGDIAGDLAEGAGEVAGDLAEGAGEVAGDLAEGAGEVAGDLAEGAGELLEGAGEIVGDLAEGAGELLEGVGEAAGGLLEGAGDAIGDLGGALEGAGDVLGDVAEGAGDLLGGVMEGADGCCECCGECCESCMECCGEIDWAECCGACLECTGECLSGLGECLGSLDC